MSVTIRPYRRGGWEVDIRVVTPDGKQQLRERKRTPVSSRSAALRWAKLANACCSTTVDPAQQTPRKEVPTLREFAPTVHGRPRAGQPAEAKRDRGEGDDPARASAAGVGAQAAGRDQDRGRAAAEARSGGEVAQDGEQRPDRAEHPAEEGGGVGRDRSDAVHGEAAAGAEGIDARSTTSTSTNGSSRRRGCSTRARISSCCWAVRRDCGAAR